MPLVRFACLRVEPPIPGTAVPVAGNILNKRFDTGIPNMSWVADVTPMKIGYTCNRGKSITSLATSSWRKEYNTLTPPVILCQ